MESLFGSGTLVSKTGEVKVADAFKGAKIVGIYFSMHTCPPCREFTPILSELYKEINESEKVFEVVFCSGDQKEELYKEYYEEQPWLALQFRDERMKGLAGKY